MLFFTEEAEKVINAFLEKVNGKIDELGFEMSNERRKDFLLAVYHSLRLSSIRHAKSRRSEIVEEKDAKASFRFLSPKMLIRHGLQNPKIFKHMEKLRAKHFQMVKEKVSSAADVRILDAGCGYGRQLMEFLRRDWKGEFFGVDIDLEAMKYGKSAESSITFIGGDVNGKLPFKDNSFDAIICIGVLHLVRDANKTIQEYARILKPNGLLFLTSSFTGNKP
ncbi:MAG: class I SAM-dependent methyltransferase, partial [Candidatus Bathyarchaeales archaeon]